MESAHRDNQEGFIAPADPQRHVAGQCVNEQTRIEETGIEPDQAAIEIDAAREIDLQLENIGVFRRQDAAQDPEQNELRLRNIENDPELERNESGRSPT